MPKRTDLQSILFIGAGPIAIDPPTATAENSAHLRRRVTAVMTP